MTKSLTILLVLIGFSISANAQETSKKKTSLEMTFLSIDYGNSDVESEQELFIVDGIGFYTLTGMGQLNKEGLYRNTHGLATSISSIVSSTSTPNTTFIGLNLGVGYGVHYNQISGYATLGTTLFAWSSIDVLGETETDSEFLPSDSGFLRLATTWKPFLRESIVNGNNGAGKPTIGLHAALDIPFAEGADPALYIGFSLPISY